MLFFSLFMSVTRRVVRPLVRNEMQCTLLRVMLCHSFVVYVFNAFVSIVIYVCFVFCRSWFVVGLLIIIYLRFFAVRVNGWSMCDISGVSVLVGGVSCILVSSVHSDVICWIPGFCF